MEMDEIARGWAVFTEDGKRLGDVVEVHPHYLLISRGLLVVRDVYVPRYAVAAAGERKVHLAITEERIKHMGWSAPPPPPPPPPVDSPSPHLTPIYDPQEAWTAPIEEADPTAVAPWSEPGDAGATDWPGAADQPDAYDAAYPAGDEAPAFEQDEVLDDYEDMGIALGGSIEVDGEVYLAARKLEPPWPMSTSPIVLIHGWGFDSRIWDYLTVDLAADGTVVTYDGRGYGRSTAPWSGYTLDQAARDLRVLLRTLELQRATLVGIDLGAAAALHYVLNGGRRAARLVLIAPALPHPDDDQADGLPEPFATWQADLRRDRPRLAARLAETWLAGASAETARWLGDGMLSAANHALIHGLDALALPYLAEPLESVALPTTIIHGRDDPVVPFARGEQAATAIPQARLIALDTPGHLPMISAPERLVAAIRGDEGIGDRG